MSRRPCSTGIALNGAWTRDFEEDKEDEDGVDEDDNGVGVFKGVIIILC